MKIIHEGPLLAVPSLSLVQITAIQDAAAGIDHELARLVELSVLAPGVADVLPGIDVNHVDLRSGTVLIHMRGGVPHGIALGGQAMDVIEAMMPGREGAGGPLLADPHGDALLPDADASALAVELVADASPITGSFRWSLPSLRSSAMLHMIAGGVSARLLASCCGLFPIPEKVVDRRRSVLEQVMVADYWSHLLDLTRWRLHLNGDPLAGWTDASDASFGAYAIRESFQ